jgi:hypothetical protein
MAQRKTGEDEGHAAADAAQQQAFEGNAREPFFVAAQHMRFDVSSHEHFLAPEQKQPAGFTDCSCGRPH